MKQQQFAELAEGLVVDLQYLHHFELSATTDRDRAAGATEPTVLVIRLVGPGGFTVKRLFRDPEVLYRRLQEWTNPTKLWLT